MTLRKITLLFVFISMLFVACDKEQDCEGTTSKNYEIDGFSRISAGSVMHVRVQKGNTFSIHAQGCSRDINDLRVRVRNNGTLEMDYERNLRRRDPVYIDISMPHFVAGAFSGASEATINGFQNVPTAMRIVLSGASKATVNGTSEQTEFNLSGASELNVSGTTNILMGTISGASELKAFEANASKVDISASGASKARVHAQTELYAEATGGSQIRYRGNPTLKDIRTSGGGQITAE